MKPSRFWLVCLLLLAAASSLRADDWPIERGPSHEPAPFRFDSKLLKTIPKDVLDDATACILYSGTTHLIEPDGTVEAISHEITRLNSRKGIDKLGEYRAIMFDPTFEKLTLNEARIIKSDGKIVPIEAKHVQLRDVATDFQVYDQDKQLVISFPNLEVGDIYEVKWTVRGKNREFGGHFFSRYTFGDDNNPVLRDEFRVRVPKNKTLKYATVNGKVDLKISDAPDDAKFYHWSATNNRPLSRDEDRPSKEELRLQVAVSTFPSWEAVAQWKQKVREECWKCTPEVQKIIAEVTRDLTTQEEKAKALTYWVRRHVRYLSRGPGGLGYTPHLPSQVLSNLYGDCKDQAQLLAVMLREIGLPVWLVTLGTLDDGQVLPDVPSPWGSHAILLTKIGGKDYWIDTTVSLAAWDFLPRGDRDRQVYVTRDAELKLMKTPAFTYQDYRIEQETRLAIQADGTARYLRDTTYHGSSAWSRRDKWLEVPPGERRRTAITELQDAHSEAKLLSLSIDEKQLGQFDKPVKARMEFEVPKQFVSDAGSLSDSPVWSWLLGYNLDTERDLPFQLPTQFESIHRFLVQLPAAQRLDSVPEERTIQSPWGFFKLKVKLEDADARKLEITMHTRVEKIRVEKGEFDEFLRFQKAVSKAYRVWLTLRPTMDIADAPGVEKYLAERKYADAATVKILARLYLDRDRQAEARALLDKATPVSPDDQGLWDLRISAAGTLEEEERLYRAAVKQFPNQGRFAVALGSVLVRREEHAAAQKVLTPLVADKEPATVRGPAHYQLARSLFRQNQAAAALKHLQAALIADPASLASMDALHFKARVQESLGQIKEAIQTLSAALDADPNAREALEYIVRLELKANLKDAALEHLRRYTVAADKDGASLLRAAELHLDMKRLDDAFDLASRTRDGAMQAKAERILGLVYFVRRDYEKAGIHLERGDLDARALAALIEAHLRQGDLDAADRRADSIRRMDKPAKELVDREKDIAALVARRDRLLTQWSVDKDRETAARKVVSRYLCAERGLAEHWPHDEIEKLIDGALQEKLEYGPLLAVRGWLRLQKGEVRKALTDANAAVKLAPADARAFLVRGRARLEQGNAQQALVDLRKATELSRREDATVLHWLAAALADAGRTRDALETQRLAVLLRPSDAELREQLQRLEALSPKSGAAVRER